MDTDGSWQEETPKWLVDANRDAKKAMSAKGKKKEEAD